MKKSSNETSAGKKTATILHPEPSPWDVHLYDHEGNFIKGCIVAGEYLRVLESNIVFRGAVLEKQPFLSWEIAMQDQNNSTFLSPSELLRMSRLLEEGWDEDEESEDESEEASSEEDFADPANPPLKGDLSESVS